jgi:hypothetical protein
VFAYQFGGTSGRGLQPAGSRQNWRCFSVAQLVDVTVVVGVWRSPSEPGDDIQSCIEKVDLRARITSDLDQCELEEAA